MKIVLSGIETNNKGAELMLYAVLQEIEQKYPNAIVFIPRARVAQGLGYLKTKLTIKFIPCEKFENLFRLNSFFYLLHLPFNLMPHMIALGKVDYYIDGSGFRFSDQFNLSHKSATILRGQLRAYRNKGARIVYLPQAFGPFEKKASKEVLDVLMEYATVLMPRERLSLEYISMSGVANMEKVRLFTDFTSLVDGTFPQKYENLRNGICIIPNTQMINKGAITLEEYQMLLKSIIRGSGESGHVVYILNHGGDKDEHLFADLQNDLTAGVEFVSGLNALQVKGLISSAYLVISSRFHGVASALNSCVPCLATSWSHKYKALFEDYKLAGCILPLNDIGRALLMIYYLLDKDNNESFRRKLSEQVPLIKEETQSMWNYVWNL